MSNQIRCDKHDPNAALEGMAVLALEEPGASPAIPVEWMNSERALVSQSDIYDAHASGRSLKQGEADQFLSRGVERNALYLPCPVRADLVVFQKNGWFEFARDVGEDGSEQAFTILVEGADGPSDIVAWQPKTHRIAFWLNRAFALGEEQIWHPCLDDDPMRIWRTPMRWLRAGRQGLVILRPKAAFFHLTNLSAISAEDFEHGQELEHLLIPPKPRTRIFVPAQTQSTNRSEAA